MTLPARIRREPITRNSGLRRKVFERDQGFCIDCGRFSAHWQHDHAVALHIGGGDTLENSVTRCKTCHRRKSNGELTVKAKTDRLAARHELTARRKLLPPTPERR